MDGHTESVANVKFKSLTILSLSFVLMFIVHHDLSQNKNGKTEINNVRNLNGNQIL